MNSRIFVLVSLFILIVFGCSKDTMDIPDETSTSLYFPEVGSDVWETISLTELGWNSSELDPLLNFVDESRSESFIILKDGKIAVEWYGNGANVKTNHTWNSAAKTLSATMIGIAQQEGFLDIHKSSRDYLGNNWSSLTEEQEKNVTIWHHLNMTTGLDYTVPNANCTEKTDLIYKNEPETFWYYHNAPYTLTHQIVEGAVGTSFDSYFNEKLKNIIGMQGLWFPFGCYKLFASNARSMARFGLLILNKGTWDLTPILTDKDYFDQMTEASQNLNKAYGYFWWLNGKNSFKLPGSEDEYSGKLISSAPDDLFAALGKDDQKIYVVPSKNMVVIRMGDSAKESAFGPSGFDTQLWSKINALIE